MPNFGTRKRKSVSHVYHKMGRKNLDFDPFFEVVVQFWYTNRHLWYTFFRAVSFMPLCGRIYQSLPCTLFRRLVHCGDFYSCSSSAGFRLSVWRSGRRWLHGADCIWLRGLRSLSICLIITLGCDFGETFQKALLVIRPVAHWVYIAKVGLTAHLRLWAWPSGIANNIP